MISLAQVITEVIVDVLKKMLALPLCVYIAILAVNLLCRCYEWLPNSITSDKHYMMVPLYLAFSIFLVNSKDEAWGKKLLVFLPPLLIGVFVNFVYIDMMLGGEVYETYSSTVIIASLVSFYLFCEYVHFRLDRSKRLKVGVV